MPNFEADVTATVTLAALGVRVIEATGLCRSHGSSPLIMGFDLVTLTAAAGATSFPIDIDIDIDTDADADIGIDGKPGRAGRVVEVPPSSRLVL
ncbi:hypothetical protein [Streptomyces sp. NPDC060198]|uniref:hypothetical protein n=1 Tax=Streptomyces sp. NPDC060198 TaxID=3347070 RepID=UPI003661FF71